ncbi:MAG: hypothetical protein DMH00_06155 [Acidobacteria bacterium]|nr:MAG: hypothetical protein DMH00_06155 [Acidobacteriota bacterium]
MIGRFEKLLLATATVLAGGSGLVYAWMKYITANRDPFSVVNHPWQPYMLSAHVLSAPALLFAFGLIVREHILGRYRDPRARRGRRTGILASWLLAPMVASGYALQALASQSPRRATGLFHLGAGILFLVFYAAHVILGSRGLPAQGSLRLSGRGRTTRAKD